MKDTKQKKFIAKCAEKHEGKNYDNVTYAETEGHVTITCNRTKPEYPVQ